MTFIFFSCTQQNNPQIKRTIIYSTNISMKNGEKTIILNKNYWKKNTQTDLHVLTAEHREENKSSIPREKILAIKLNAKWNVHKLLETWNGMVFRSHGQMLGVSSRGDTRESALSLSFTLLLSAESLALTQHGHTLWLAGAPTMRTCLAGWELHPLLWQFCSLP